MNIEANKHLSWDSDLQSDFENFTGLKVKCNVLASKLSTFRIGGPIQYLIEPEQPQELVSALKWLRSNNQSYKLLGYGSNVLINSEGLSGWVLRLGKGFSGVEYFKDNLFKVGAACSLTSLSRDLSQKGISGLEFAGGIPASLGGAVRMNAGAHSGEMSAVFKAVEGYDNGSGFLRISASELQFDYRRCSLPADFLITAVELQLFQSDKDQVFSKLLSNLEYRKKTQPLTLASAGSIFRNPSKELSAGALLDRLGLKGSKSGQAEVSSLHANWIVNPKKRASSEDVLNLIYECQFQAQEREGISLQPELVIW